MAPRVRQRRRAVRAAYIGGLLLFLTGSTGALALVRFGWRALQDWAPALGGLLKPVFLFAALIAFLGGISVMVGGWLLDHDQRWPGKIVIALGAGVGVVAFVLYLVLVIATGGNPLRILTSMALSLHGLGLLLSLYAQAIS